MMLAALVLSQALVHFVPAARADDGAAPSDATDERAKELYENGAELYDEGRYDDAVAAWEESYKLSNRALLLYNIANAEERAGHYDAALDHLNRYRAFATADEREILDRRIRNLEARIDQSRPASSPATAPTTTAAAPTSPATSQTTAPTSSAAPPTTSSSTTKVTRSGPSVPTYILGGVGVAGIAAGAVFGLGATGARGAAEKDCNKVGEDTYCTSEARKALKQDALESVLADVSFGVGGAALIGAVVTALLDEPVGVLAIPGGGGLSLSGRF